MTNIRTKFALGIAILITGIMFPPAANAVCPVCVVAVGAGVGLSRYLGIDDTVSGLWIGGLLVASSYWLADWTQKRGWKIPYRLFLSLLLFYISAGVPLVYSDIIGHPANKLWGIDRLLLGIAAGTVLFFLNIRLDKWLRSKNNDRVHFAYQKVVVPVVLLLLGSLAFFLLTR